MSESRSKETNLSPSGLTAVEGTNKAPLSSKTDLSLKGALLIADSHAQIDDVLEYVALRVLASAVRAAQIHTADQCSAVETTDVQESIDRNTAYERDIAELEKVLQAAVDQFPNDDGWLDRAKALLAGDRLPEEPKAPIARKPCPHGAAEDEVCPQCLGAPSDNPDDEITSVQHSGEQK